MKSDNELIIWTVDVMCAEVWERWSGCGHLTFKGFHACDDWSEAHPAPNEEGSEDCENYVAGDVHDTEEMVGRCVDCAHLPSPPDTDDSDR